MTLMQIIRCRGKAYRYLGQWENANLDLAAAQVCQDLISRILIFLQFLNAIDYDILMASLLGYTILDGTRTRARNQLYSYRLSSTFAVFEYTIEAKAYFFQIFRRSKY